MVERTAPNVNFPNLQSLTLSRLPQQGNRAAQTKGSPVKLDEFIEKCGQDGQLESEGSFSIDSLGALRKSLASALPEPHYYLFQLLQALHQIGAGDVKVAVGRRENRITFLDPQEALSDLNKLSSYFQKGLSVSSNDPLEQIMSGLVTSLGCHVSSAELHSGNQKLSVTVKGLTVDNLSREVSRPSLVMKRALEKGLSYSWSRIWGARKEEFRIRKSFEHSPLPIQIAGLSTTPRASWRRSMEGDGRFCLVEVAVLNPGSPNHAGEEHKSSKKGTDAFYLTEAEGHGASDNTELAVVPTYLLLGLDAQGAVIQEPLSDSDWNQRLWTFALTNSGEKLAQVQFVRNGFNIETQNVDLGLAGLHIVAPADDLAVDATGYKLVQNEAHQRRLEEAQKMVETIKQTLQELPLERVLSQMGKSSQGVLASFPWYESAQ